MGQLFLGIDAGTQSLAAIIIDAHGGRITASAAISFAEDLPHYNAPRGFLPSEDPRRAEAPPLMWVEAMDQLLLKLGEGGVPMRDIRAVSVSGQQHGSVYLRADFADAMAKLRPDMSPIAAVRPQLVRKRSPIWMDSSTSDECAEIRKALGGDAAAAALTGSAVIERFTGPQIRRIWKQEPDVYAHTAHIALVSSFLTSILAGSIAPIDHGDGAGMNLMDIHQRIWSEPAVEATAPGLASRLPPLCSPDAVIGTVAPALARRYGMEPGTRVCAASGDNPNSAIGLGLVRPGMTAVSLGTSDTVFGLMAECRTDPRAEGHVFIAPTGACMCLICFKNGSFARERVRDAFGLDWAGFEAAVARRPPGNGGALMLPWFVPEIVPRILDAGVRRFNLAPDDAAANCRAVLEAQAMAQRLHAAWMGITPAFLYATGGASRSRTLLQVMADVHQCPVYPSPVPNTAALGAALRAAHADLTDGGKPVTWEALTVPFAKPIERDRVDPDPATARTYDRLLPRYSEVEKEAAGR